MTTTQIVSYANEEGLVVGSSDMNLEVRLRHKVIPKWEMDVGECAWRRKNTTISVLANTRGYDLPSDFGKMLEVPVLVDAAGVKTAVHYAGEDAVAMGLGDGDTIPGSPSLYWFVRVTGPPTELRALRFNKIPSQAFTLRYTYLSEIQFADETTAVELRNYIPKRFEWALVEALRIEIYAGRIAINDPRISIAQNSYQSYVNDAIDYREPGMRLANKRIKTGPL